jgi:hypothetical protein
MVGVRGWCLGRWRWACGAVQSFGEKAKDVGSAAWRRSSAAWVKVKQWVAEWWARRNPPAMIVLAITLLAVFVLAMEWCLIGGKTILALDAFDLIGEPEKKVEAYGKLLPAIGLLAAAPVGVAGVALAFWRSWNQHRDGMTAIRKLDAEVFAKAVEQLGHDKSSIRMGAVLALEALGKSTPRFLSQAIELLCAYVREMRPVSPIAPTDETAENVPTPPLPTDIQLILDIIKRLKREDTGNRIKVDLSGTNLRMANFRMADLSRADLSRADLSGADLLRATMTSADLTETNLSGADLLGATVDRADLTGANLAGVMLNQINLAEATLRNADLRNADLTRGNLTNADLSGANLAEAFLSATNFTSANLTDANFTDANAITPNFTDTIFENTTLPDGTVWTGKGPPPGFPPAPVTNA